MLDHNLATLAKAHDECRSYDQARQEESSFNI